jgi:hypothetical protein
MAQERPRTGDRTANEQGLSASEGGSPGPTPTPRRRRRFYTSLADGLRYARSALHGDTLGHCGPWPHPSESPSMPGSARRRSMTRDAGHKALTDRDDNSLRLVAHHIDGLATSSRIYKHPLVLVHPAIKLVPRIPWLVRPDLFLQARLQDICRQKDH